jgi:hypothetical protein
MNQDPRITCPKCGAEIALTDSLAGPLVAATRAEYEERLRQQDEAVAEREAMVAQKTRDLNTLVNERVQQARRAADEEARQNVEIETTKLRQDLATAQQAQAEALKKERDLESRERALELTVQTRINQSLAAERETLQREFSEAGRLALAEKETQLDGMRRVIEDLKAKASQGSQQTQGEVQEEDLKARLLGKFRQDEIGDVEKGVAGADLTQRVMTLRGDAAGLILWESKRTKSFSSAWLPKLRADGRAAKADILVLITQALPDGVETFDCLDGVWIAGPRHALPLAAVLREALLRTHAERLTQVGLETKAELVYAWVTGPQFRRRVEAVVEAFATMKEDLDAEKRAFAKVWAKREVQLERALVGAAGLMGDAQGAGADVAEIEALSVKALGGGRE